MRTHIPTCLSMGQTAHLYTSADLQIPNASCSTTRVGVSDDLDKNDDLVTPDGLASSNLKMTIYDGFMTDLYLSKKTPI